MSKHNQKGISVPSRGRSRLTNNAAALPGLDGRNTWSRRLRDLIALHTADLGGKDVVSTAEASIIRRAACITIELERLELRFAMDKATDAAVLDQYQRAANSLRRLLESVGLKRRLKDVSQTLSSYLEGKAR